MTRNIGFRDISKDSETAQVGIRLKGLVKTDEISPTKVFYTLPRIEYTDCLLSEKFQM